MGKPSDDERTCIHLPYNRKEAERAFKLITDLMMRENVAVIDGVAACQAVVANYVEAHQLAAMPVQGELPQ